MKSAPRNGVDQMLSIPVNESSKAKGKMTEFDSGHCSNNARERGLRP